MADDAVFGGRIQPEEGAGSFQRSERAGCWIGWACRRGFGQRFVAGVAAQVSRQSLGSEAPKSRRLRVLVRRLRKRVAVRKAVASAEDTRLRLRVTGRGVFVTGEAAWSRWDRQAKRLSLPCEWLIVLRVFA